MSERGRRDLPPVIERLVPDAFAGDDGSPTVSTFLRGVTTGALVGAAIAGSALLTRYRRRREADAVERAAGAAKAAGEAPITGEAPATADAGTQLPPS